MRIRSSLCLTEPQFSGEDGEFTVQAVCLREQAGKGTGEGVLGWRAALSVQWSGKVPAGQPLSRRATGERSEPYGGSGGTASAKAQGSSKETSAQAKDSTEASVAGDKAEEGPGTQDLRHL